MSVEYVTMLRCDEMRTRDCLGSFSAVVNLKETRRLARLVGWVHRRDPNYADVCPACELAR